MSIFFSPTTSFRMSVDLISMASVRSRRVPVGSFRRNWNCPLLSLGKISRPIILMQNATNAMTPMK